MLTLDQQNQFHENGYVVLRSLIPAEIRGQLLSELDNWVELSRSHMANYGFDTPDGKARFDLEHGHSGQKPRLRRVANPCDISEAYRGVLFKGVLPEAVACLIGPDVKFHHCKLNNKFPGMNTRVEYHADHPYDPHTNDDGITMMLLLDDMDEDNGCLRLVPASHKERYSHFKDSSFIGSTDPTLFEAFDSRAKSLIGRAGDVCLMDIWTMHGGGPNTSKNRPRRVLIADYRAADAFPLTSQAVPAKFNGKIVAGKSTHIARLHGGTMEILGSYEDDSFFGLQGQKSAGENDQS